MKTVLFINSSGARYYKREGTNWHRIEKPDQQDKLWVIANLPDEMLEATKLPLLFGRDRSHFLERRLAAAFPHSQYRAAPIIEGNLLKPNTVVLAGLTASDAVTSQLDKLHMPIAGVWGISMLLTLMARRLSLRNVILALPSVHFLRILVIKDGIPVITRCIHRYSEDDSSEHDGDANEIARTCQHLENRHIFEHQQIPQVLYLGESTRISEHLAHDGLSLMRLPAAFSPKGDAAFLHPIFQYVLTTPHGQLAPLALRAGHLTEKIRQAAYIGILASLVCAILFGQKDFRALIDLHGQESNLRIAMQQATQEREKLADRINSTGMNPALVRQATKFSSIEMEVAPTPESLFKFTAALIADLPQVRIKNLSFRFPNAGEHYCQGQSIINLPLINGSKPSDADVLRHTELQFSILLTENLPPAAQAELRKRISAEIKTKEDVQLMQDPAAFSLINTLKGGFGMDTTQTENLWCMSIPWQLTPPLVHSSDEKPTSIAPVPGTPESLRNRPTGEQP